MERKRIAVVFGGYSTEYEVSLQSAAAVLENLDGEQYEVVPVGITREGEWYRYQGSYDRIRDGRWMEDASLLVPVVISQSRGLHGMLEFVEGSFRPVRLDLAFPVLHGKFGEDGTVQGLMELAGIPVVGCGTLSSALCMDKDMAHRLVAAAGVAVPRSVVLLRAERGRLFDALAGLQYPLFVKPARAGSSFGVSKVAGPEQMEAAVELAFSHDDKVVVEENVDGFEVGCAVLGTEELLVGRVDEIELSEGFFDYTEKYTLQSSKIHMPARIDEACEERVRETARKIYRTLGCSGFARVDMFLRPSGEVVFNEVNTIPGFTSHSRYPNMMKGIGLSFGDVLKKLIGLYL
ncbi:MAG: D-alanine--D-serine ligase VanG [Candidatus Gastranaerophilales bacterium]|nr:D-alanine--D-serine ligase VanG [Candidatus Gastranaerophilales bacterium]